MDRFVVHIEERAVRNSYQFDRYWSIIDQKGRKFVVAQVHVTYPQAEKQIRDYCAYLNQTYRELSE